MLAKLSLRNAKRQAGDYTVYIITITLAAALIYAFNSLVTGGEIQLLSSMLDDLSTMIVLASVVVVAILGWLVYYTQQFMLAKRSRELGTYILLGLENKQVARMYLGENLLVGLLSLAMGVLLGGVVHQGLRAVILALFGQAFRFRLSFSPAAIGLTIAYFAVVFLVSSLLCVRRIRKATIRGMMELERQNEGETVKTGKSRKRLFTAALACGVAGTLLLITRDLTLAVLGSLLLIFFCYGFFISFSSGVPAFFNKRPAKKYKGGTLLVFRSLSTKLASMGVTMGTIALLLTATLLAEGSALLFQNQFNQNGILTTGFDLYIAAPAEYADMSAYEGYIEENLEVTASHVYSIMDGEDRAVTNYLQEYADYWNYYEYDQIMRYSDYAALREMLGYTPAELGGNEYIIHCMQHLAPTLEGYTRPLTLNGGELQRGNMYNEILTQFQWDGNGRGFILVVPDEAATGLTPTNQMWAMMTAEPVTGAEYAGIEAIRDARADTTGELVTLYETLLSKGNIKDEYASMSALIVFPLFYLALILAMVAATILTIQFLSDAKKYRRQYAILRDMGMDRREMRRTLNRHFAIYYAMPVLPPVLICVAFMFSLGKAFDPGVIISTGHLWALIGISLALFLAIYLLYTAAASNSLKKTVLPK